MAWLTSKLGAIAAGIGAALIIIIAIFRAGRKSKSDEVQAETAKTVIKTAKKGKEIEKVNRKSGAKSRRDRLREYSGDN